MIRFDYVFSYWVFLWYVTFMLKLIPFNPIVFLIIAGIVNTGQLLSGNVGNPKSFIIINFFIKVIPIYTLLNIPIKNDDIIAGFIYLALYIIWMTLNKQSVIKARTPLSDFFKNYGITLK